MDKAPDITVVDEDNDKDNAYDIKYEYPQDNNDTTRDNMDEYVEPNEKQNEQENHRWHESIRINNTKTYIKPPHDENNDASQEH